MCFIPNKPFTWENNSFLKCSIFKMGVKNNPSTLYDLSLQKVSTILLQQWRDTYYTNYARYSEELKDKVGVIIPCTIYDQVFGLMVESHARFIQYAKQLDNVPSISCLIDSIIVPHLRKLNLDCLRHMGTVRDEEIRYLEGVLTSEIPSLANLVEISLQTSGTDFTLPTCNDEMMEKIGNSCPKLKALDISYNHTVTDKGLQFLLHYDDNIGCPLLNKISLFECSVTAEGVALLLEGLPRLRFLGYRETGQSLLFLDRKAFLGRSSVNKLELAHINNLGTISRTCKDIYKLKCDEKLVDTIFSFCPKLTGLKVRVSDSQVKLLQVIKSVNILDLVFNLGTPSSPGSNTIQYLNICGTQFVSLSFVCDTFTTQHLKVVCEQCNNLKRFWIRCNTFSCNYDISNLDRKKCSLTNLEVFFFRAGYPSAEICRIPHSTVSYVLHKSNILREIVLAMKNELFSDCYMQELFSSVNTSVLKEIMILVPHKNLTLSSLNLSMSTVETLIFMCPQLEKLGNLLVWDVSLEEIEELRRQLKLSNSVLILWYKHVLMA